LAQGSFLIVIHPVPSGVRAVAARALLQCTYALTPWDHQAASGISLGAQPEKQMYADLPSSLSTFRSFALICPLRKP
jgi:hypothetical protein